MNEKATKSANGNVRSASRGHRPFLFFEEKCASSGEFPALPYSVRFDGESDFFNGDIIVFQLNTRCVVEKVHGFDRAPDFLMHLKNQT